MEKIVKDDDDIFAALNDDENTASIGIEPKSLKASERIHLARKFTNSPQPCEVSTSETCSPSWKRVLLVRTWEIRR